MEDLHLEGSLPTQFLPFWATLTRLKIYTKETGKHWTEKRPKKAWTSSCMLKTCSRQTKVESSQMRDKTSTKKRQTMMIVHLSLLLVQRANLKLSNIYVRNKTNWCYSYFSRVAWYFKYSVYALVYLQNKVFLLKMLRLYSKDVWKHCIWNITRKLRTKSCLSQNMTASYYDGLNVTREVPNKMAT